MANAEQTNRNTTRAQESIQQLRALLDDTEQALNEGRLAKSSFRPGDDADPAELAFLLDRTRALMMCW